ncbi:MAG TPA: hypothetical protein ENI42_04630, partial [Thermoplasmatales archaeon]|nr:hypothetical protein [Thermoplasmatales archaeon]
MKKSMVIAGIVTIIFMYSIVFSQPTSAQPALPHQFWGKAQDDTGKSIADGITIRAMIVDTDDGSTQNFTQLVYDGWYGWPLENDSRALYVESEGGDSGDPIYFYIGDINTSQSVNFVPGGATNLTLTIPDVPRILADNSDTSGTTGDPFTFNVTIGEYVDSGDELTVKVNWTHGSLSGNETMIPTGGSNVNGFYFETTITLDDCGSILSYTIYVNDTSGNHNSSGPHNVAVIDNDPPQTTLELGSPIYNNFVTTSTPVYLNATDNCSNWYIHYRIWNENTGWSSWYVGNQNENLITTFSEEGKHYIEYYANDTSVLNNTETTHNETYYVDDTSPTTTLTIGSPNYPSSNDGCNVTSATIFNLTATDEPTGAASGVAFTWYTVDGDYYTGTSFTLSGYGEGSHTITWGSQDNLGNNESGNSITVWVDDSPPSTTLSVGSPRYPSSPDDGCNVTSSTLFTLSASDNPVHGSGVAFSWYRDNGVYHVYSGPFTLSGEGQHVITYGSQDNLGNNESGNSITVWVDDSPPSTTLSVGSPRYPSSPDDGCNVTSSTVFTLSATDNPTHNSGVAFTWYTVDGDYYTGTSFTLSGYGEGSHTITWGSQDN